MDNSKIKFSKTLILNSKEGKEVLWEQAIFQIEKEIEKEIEKVFGNFFFLMQTSHMFSVCSQMLKKDKSRILWK